MDEQRNSSDVPVSTTPYKPANNREQLLEWLKEIVPFSVLEKYVREKDCGAGHFGFTLCTGQHSYLLYGHELTPEKTSGHLGCLMVCRLVRAGENWQRGSDLPDGPFNPRTWESIKDAIIRSEAVKLAPVTVPMGLKDGESLPDLSMFRTHTFYGPHSCEECGLLIVRQDRLKGGVKFDALKLEDYETYPSNRPDLPWKLHECPPRSILAGGMPPA